MSVTPSLSRAHLAAVIHSWQMHGRAQWLTVRGDSMWPLLRAGDAVLICFSHAPVRPGDVALIWPQSTGSGRPLLHRIVHVDTVAATVISQGDNRRRPDAPQPLAAVCGVGVARRRHGKVTQLAGARCRPTRVNRWLQRGRRAAKLFPSTIRGARSNV